MATRRTPGHGCARRTTLGSPRRGRQVALGFALLLVATAPADDAAAPPAEHADAPPRTTPQASASQPAAVPTFRGLAVQIQTNHRVIEDFLPLLDEIAALGANSVLLTTPAWMEHAGSQRLYIEQRKTPSRADLVELMRSARRRHLKVIFMPIILLAEPRGSEWRGLIQPPDWPQWWDEYRELLRYYADTARMGRATAFIVGSELVQTEQMTEQWQRTIALVRERFPEAELGYSANWDTYDKVTFWNELDFAGLTSYFELHEDETSTPTTAELVAAWQPIYERITTWQQQVDRPLVFTEVGWCSQVGAAAKPWNYYLNQRATPQGHEEQRRLYAAFLDVWGRAPGVGGVLWWEWTPDPGGAGDFGFTPENKPAETLLRRWFAECRRAAKP